MNGLRTDDVTATSPLSPGGPGPSGRRPVRRRPAPRLRARSLGAAAAAAVLLLAPATAASAATQPADTTQPSWVRAAHLVPDLPQMDIDLTPRDGGATTTVEGAGYGDVSTYVKAPAGAYDVGIRPLGSAPGSTPVLTSTVQTEAGKAYTLAALGTAADARIVPLEDDLTPPAAGQARIRVLSAASTASAVDVVAVDGPAIVRAAPFASSTSYADVPAGRWTLRATPSSGSTGGAGAGSADVDLTAGSTYTLAVTNGEGGAGALEVTPIADARGTADGQVPVGGAATGAGGTAAGGPVGGSAAAPLAGGLVGAGAAVVAGGLVLLRRRRTTSATAA